jgi:starch-binding outer membrane protein, SusD/RagB family
MAALRFYILFVLSIFLFSCKKGFLSLSPPSAVDVNAFYKTEEDIKLGVNAAYSTLRTDGQYRVANWQVGEVRSDNSYNWEGGGNFPDAEIDQFKEGTANNILNAMWLDTYHGILFCNIILNRISGITMSDDARKQYAGEILFLRALMYFNLVRTFGDVPLVLKETPTVQEGYSQGRTSAGTVYKQIITDLDSASKNLPALYSAENIGRATSGAAKSLLGKVYLTRHEYASAALILKEVVDAGRYNLLLNYADLWKPANANHAESIFEVQFKKGGQGTGSPYSNFFAPHGSELAVTIIGFANGRNLPTPDIIAAYENGDRRKAASIALSYQLNGRTINDPYTLKYRDIPYLQYDADDNWTVLRYADVLLMYAEALNEINNGPNEVAYAMINAVRKRAGLDSVAINTDKNTFAAAIAHERQVELAFEGHRWFDLLRTGRAQDIMNTHFNGTITVQPYQLLFAVPQSQVDINPSLITQNSGY